MWPFVSSFFFNGCHVRLDIMGFVGGATDTDATTGLAAGAATGLLVTLYSIIPKSDVCLP